MTKKRKESKRGEQIVVTFGENGSNSKAIEDKAADDECNDLRAALESLHAAGPSTSLDEFRRRHGLK
jgi:hypothetical protein